jgi:hypothetical protein
MLKNLPSLPLVVAEDAVHLARSLVLAEPADPVAPADLAEPADPETN